MSEPTRSLRHTATLVALLLCIAATPSPDALVSRLAPLYQRLDARDVAPHLWLAMREDPHPDVRRLAARVLASVADPAHLRLLEQYHRDGSPAVRVEAMVAAGRLGPTGAGLARAGIVDVSPAVRQAASWAAAHGGEAGCAELLARITVERDPAVLATMVGNLFRCDGLPWEAAALAPAMSPDPDLRRAAAAALARGSGHEALDRLARDVEPVIRATALAGMTRGPFPPERSALVVDALGDADWRVRAAACAVLASRADAPLAAEVGTRLVALARESQAHLRVAAVRAIGAHPEVASTTDLLGWIATESPWVAGEALDAAARRHPDLALATVSGWLGSTEGWRRRAAAAAVPRLPVASRAALELRVMGDRDPAVRLAWLERLEGMPAGRGEWLRSRLADDGDPAVRSAILDLLAGAGEAGDPEGLLERARAWRHDLLGDARASALLAALRGSTEEGFRRRVIARALDDPDDAVAARVAGAARELGLAVSLPPREARHGAGWYRDLVTWADEPRWLDVETERGSFRIRLDAAAAPLTAREVFDLASTGFYDGLTIHRVVPNFVVQGGDPRGDGWGGPGFTLPDEPTVVPFDSWRVGIATSGPHTGGCQLFVSLVPADRLTGHYTNLGEVVEGREVLTRLEVGDRIQRVAAVSGAPGPLRPPAARPRPSAAP